AFPAFAALARNIYASFRLRAVSAPVFEEQSGSAGYFFILYKTCPALSRIFSRSVTRPAHGPCSALRCVCQCPGGRFPPLPAQRQFRLPRAVDMAGTLRFLLPLRTY